MKCQSINGNGRPCQARAQAGSDFCYFHNPKAARKRRQAQSRGGRGRRRMLPVNIEVDLANLETIPALLSFAVKGLLEGRLDAKTGHAIFHGMQTRLRTYELATMKAQIDKIERWVEAERNRKPQNSDINDLLRFEPDDAVDIPEDTNKVERRS
jgi:hypothetical protein